MLFDCVLQLLFAVLFLQDTHACLGTGFTSSRHMLAAVVTLMQQQCLMLCVRAYPTMHASLRCCSADGAGERHSEAICMHEGCSSCGLCRALRALLTGDLSSWLACLCEFSSAWPAESCMAPSLLAPRLKFGLHGAGFCEKVTALQTCKQAALCGSVLTKRMRHVADCILAADFVSL
jgi:hypothetical protein